MDLDKIAQLVLLAQKGDKKALNDLCDETTSFVYRTVKRKIDNEDEALDITQDTFVELLENLPKLQEPRALLGWLSTVALNKCKNQFKRKKPVLFHTQEEEEAVLGSLQEWSVDAVPNVWLEDMAKHQIITGMVDALPVPQRDSIYYYYYNELSIQEIAGIMDVSPGTVKTRLMTARHTIEGKVSEEERKGNKLYVLLPYLGRVLREDASHTPAPEHVTQAVHEALSGFAGSAGPGTASGGAAAAEGAAATAEGAAAQAGSAAGTGLAVKIAAGLVAAALVVGGVAVVATRNTPPAPTPSPTQTAEAVLPPSPTPSASPAPAPTPTPEAGPQVFVPEEMLGQDLSVLVALCGEADSTQPSGNRTVYFWDGPPSFFVTVDTGANTIEEIYLNSSEFSLLGLTLGDSEAEATAALQQLSSFPLSSNTYNGVTNYMITTADGATLYGFDVQDGTIISLNIHRNYNP